MKVLLNYNEQLKQLLSFGVVGIIITLLGLMIFWLCVYVGIHYQIANAIGFIITVVIAYVLNHRFTFNKRKGALSIKGMFKAYASYSITGLFLAAFLLWLWTERLGINKNVAPLLNLMFTIPINFLLNKFWVYKNM